MDFVDFNTESMIQGRVDGLSAGTSFFLHPALFEHTFFFPWGHLAGVKQTS